MANPPDANPNPGALRDKVRSAYSSAAGRPGDRHPFPVGRAFAESLGYPPDWLDRVPAASLDAFAGVSNVPCYAQVPPHSAVLDLGCGAGMDSLLMARRLGPRGRVVGIDFSPPMLDRARRAAADSGAANVLFCQADAERLPLAGASIDAAILNGIFNLNPARQAIFRELARCLRPGAPCYAAELILREPLPPAAAASEDNWFA